MIYWYAGSIIAGSIFGIVFCYIFRKTVPYGFTTRYWKEMTRNIFGLLKGDESIFWSYYRNIIRETFRYTALQFVGIFLAILPLIISVMTTWPKLQSTWNQTAPLKIFPKEAGKIIDQGKNAPADQRKIPNRTLNPNPNRTLVLKNGYKQYLTGSNYAFYETGSLAGKAMGVFGFKAIPVDPSVLNGHKIVIVRGYHNDRNPLWPYLSDLEFLFFLIYSITSIILMLRTKNVGIPSYTKGYNLGMIDNFLTLFATRYARTMSTLGDWESRIMADKLDSMQVKEPIFLTGLARAGTTILLETIAKAEGVATHRYRDFPFIMTPIFWNRFISMFAARQVPVERPNKDRIKITRESPDAFEEPIWQHFFPFLHDPNAIHVLNQANGNEAFEKFYREHIKKITIMRNGSRYLSKGNYNLTRIEYIDSIFADARFLIPVRHPLSHIESLVRQHLLFQDYAAHNPQVPEYLMAVGHYEFGPQRRPICLTNKMGNRIMTSWKIGDSHLGYAVQWAEIYRFVAKLYKKEPDLANRIHVIRYEDLCSNPLKEIQKVLNFVNLGMNDTIIQACRKIKSPAIPLNLSEDKKKLCWKEVEDVAATYGYSMELSKTIPFLCTMLSET